MLVKFRNSTINCFPAFRCHCSSCTHSHMFWHDEQREKQKPNISPHFFAHSFPLSYQKWKWNLMRFANTWEYFACVSHPEYIICWCYFVEKCVHFILLCLACCSMFNVQLRQILFKDCWNRTNSNRINDFEVKRNEKQILTRNGKVEYGWQSQGRGMLGCCPTSK